MIDFIYNLFKSEETKVNEEYEMYKAKYGDKITILQKGNRYAIQYLLPYVRTNTVFTSSFHYESLESAKKYYVVVCRDYDFEQLPVKVI